MRCKRLPPRQRRLPSVYTRADLLGRGQRHLQRRFILRADALVYRSRDSQKRAPQRDRASEPRDRRNRHAADRLGIRDRSTVVI